MLLLMVCLPLQGWAAMTMAVAMAAVPHAHTSTGPVQQQAAAAVGHHAHGADHHAHGMQGACCPDTADAAESAGGSHGPCGDSCQCCITAAPPATAVALGVQAPLADWDGSAPSARLQAVAFTLDKPPKA